MVRYYEKLKNGVSRLNDLSLLLLRLILAYGFLEPAKMKVTNIDGIIQWFSGMNYPLPALNAYLAATAESLGVVLLFLGLGSRIISIPLMFTMLVAIFTVHIGNGFAAGENGFEIPLYYFLMLFALLVFGSGKYSLDHLISIKRKQKN